MVVVDPDPLERGETYVSLEAGGVPLEILPRLVLALPRTLRLPGGVLLLPAWEGDWGLGWPALGARAEEWLTTRLGPERWRVRPWWHLFPPHDEGDHNVCLAPPRAAEAVATLQEDLRALGRRRGRQEVF